MSNEAHEYDRQTVEAAETGLKIWRFCCLPITIFGPIIAVALLLRACA